ncbi:MAG: glycosyltransferase [Rhodospirillaceae bacterium]|nr:glycosyltransferase [Rhodospirillaceae bacterium]
MARILFRTVSTTDRPIGGVKAIFQAAAILADAGVDARVATAAGMPKWLSDDPIASRAVILNTGDVVEIGRSDVVVLHESLDERELEAALRLRCPVVLYCQNHVYLSRNQPLVDVLRERWPIASVSEVARSAIARMIGRDNIRVIPPNVDQDTFRPTGRKRPRSIALMPRKHRNRISETRTAIEDACGPEPIDWIEIDDVSAIEAASRLAEAEVFLSLGRDEGFSLPPVEAMAAGCLVAGFESGGMADYTSADNGYWCAEGNFSALPALASAALDLAGNEEASARMRAAGQATAARFRPDRVLPAWRDWLDHELER